eukprot:Tamp_07402.p1 GENE.Tamp_07402~~Tamp_07402.p1  ORF type:complete len:223 (+),score=54.97 Tamp_07402:36-671(+)
MPFGAKKAAAGLAGLTPEQLYQQAKEQFDGPDGPEKWRGVGAACQQLLASESAHGFMCEAHYMLAMSLQNTLLHTSYMIDDAMKHFEKSMSDACRPAGLTDTQWLCKKSDTCAHMAFVYRSNFDFPNAERYWKESLQLNTHNVVARNDYIKFLCNCCRVQESLECAEYPDATFGFKLTGAGNRLWSKCFLCADQQSNDALFREHQASLQKS